MPELKNEWIGFRCTEQERLAWERAAKEDGRNLSNWIVRELNLATSAPALGNEFGYKKGKKDVR